MTDLDAFTHAYITAALWSTCDESTPDGGEPLDRHYTLEDIASESLDAIRQDCALFQSRQADDLADASARYDTSRWTADDLAGHDYWLTRCGSGTGYWDRDLGDVGERLTRAACLAGEAAIYVGDDGWLHYYSPSVSQWSQPVP